MALTTEIISANDALKGLSEEQINTIVTLSANDENAVIARRFGEVYREMDNTIAEATGIARNGDEKTYNYLKRATEAFADKFKDYDSLKESKTTLEAKVASLEEQIAKGGDEALRTELENTKRELTSVKGEFASVKAEVDKVKADSAKELNEYKINSEFANAKVGFKFKTSFGDVALNALVAQAERNVKAMNPSFEERDGKTLLVFHDKDNNPLLNKNNKLEPFTAKELLEKEYETLGILDIKKTKGAGGSGEGGEDTLALGDAKTQVEAETLIKKVLSDKGISVTNPKFAEEHDKLWKENNISSLPLK